MNPEDTGNDGLTVAFWDACKEDDGSDEVGNQSRVAMVGCAKGRIDKQAIAQVLYNLKSSAASNLAQLASYWVGVKMLLSDVMHAIVACRQIMVLANRFGKLIDAVDVDVLLQDNNTVLAEIVPTIPLIMHPMS